MYLNGYVKGVCKNYVKSRFTDREGVHYSIAYLMVLNSKSFISFCFIVNYHPIISTCYYTLIVNNPIRLYALLSLLQDYPKTKFAKY